MSPLTLAIAFPSYCDHDLSKELDDVCKTLLQDVVRFQDRQYNKDPVKAKARRRYIVGLREVKKFLVVKKVRLVVIAPDLENVEGKGKQTGFIITPRIIFKNVD